MINGLTSTKSTFFLFSNYKNFKTIPGFFLFPPKINWNRKEITQTWNLKLRIVKLSVQWFRLHRVIKSILLTSVKWKKKKQNKKFIEFELELYLCVCIGAVLFNIIDSHWLKCIGDCPLRMKNFDIRVHFQLYSHWNRKCVKYFHWEFESFVEVL